MDRSARPFVPQGGNIEALRAAMQACRGCELYKNATQAVGGEGPRNAHILIVGEQPGDREDLERHPFVGPAGRLLDRALIEAEISRREVFITNAVKHFKWAARGKRRLHQKPNMSETRACLPWLEAEIQIVKPTVILAMGVTAAQSIFGRAVRLSDLRGESHVTRWSQKTFVTVHPSSMLRIADQKLRNHEFKEFVEDLKRVRQAEEASDNSFLRRVMEFQNQVSP